MDNELKRYIKLVPFMGETLGPAFEVILFDLTELGQIVVASANVRDSSVEKARALALEAMECEKTKMSGYVVNRGVETNPGKLSKISVFYVRNGKEEIVGALCICMKCDPFLKLETIIEGFLRFDTDDIGIGMQETELFKSVSREPSLDGISNYIRSFGIESGRTNLDERMEIICDLYDMGVFNLKGAVARTAEELQISTKSVYRYLANIKKVRD